MQNKHDQRQGRECEQQEVLSKNTTKELVAHEYARIVCSAVTLLVDGSVDTLRLDAPEEIRGVGGGSYGAGVTGGGEEDAKHTWKCEICASTWSR